MASQSETTTDHDTIKQWAEDHGGKPVSVKGTPNSDDDAGLLQIDMPGGAGDESFEEITWDQWFEKFEDNNLALLYQKEKSDGSDSTFFKLVKR